MRRNWCVCLPGAYARLDVLVQAIGARSDPLSATRLPIPPSRRIAPARLAHANVYDVTIGYIGGARVAYLRDRWSAVYRAAPCAGGLACDRAVRWWS